MTKYVLLFFMTTLSISHAGSTNPFLPLWAQHCSFETVTLNETLPLKTLIQTWASIHHENLIIYEPCPNPLRMIQAHQLPWSSVIHTALQNTSTTLKKEGSIWTLRPSTLTTHWVPLQFTSPEKLSDYTQHLSHHFPKNTLQADLKLKGLWITTTPDQFRIIQKQLNRIDTPTPSIQFDITLAEVESEWLKSWGIQWLKNHKNPNSILNDLFSASSSLSALWPHQLTDHLLLKQLLSTLNNNTHHSLIAHSHLRTNNEHPATIESGLIVPYLTKDSRNRNQLLFKPVQLSIQLIPHLKMNSHLTLSVDITHDRLQSAHEDNTPPIIESNHLNTTLNTQLGQLMMLSSLISSDAHHSKNQHTPFATIPLLGQLFESRYHNESNRHLLIFIQATLNPQHTSPKHTQRRYKKARMYAGSNDSHLLKKKLLIPAPKP